MARKACFKSLSLLTGAAREFPQAFVDDYLRMVRACAERDRTEVILRSTRMGFLTGKFLACCSLLFACAVHAWLFRECNPLLACTMLVHLPVGCSTDSCFIAHGAFELYCIELNCILNCILQKG